MSTIGAVDSDIVTAKATEAVMKAMKDAKKKKNGKERNQTLWWHLNTEGVKTVELKIEYMGKLHSIMDYKNLNPKAYVVLDDMADAPFSPSHKERRVHRVPLAEIFGFLLRRSKASWGIQRPPLVSI